jgi:hypothetical protein
VVALPSLEVKELYSNNTFLPKPSNPPVLEPGHYISYMLLKKNDSIVEKIPLLEFDMSNENQLQPNPQKQAASGYLLYEGVEAQDKLPEAKPVQLASAPDFSLSVQLSQNKFKSSAKTTLATEWNLAKDTALNYEIRWYWLDSNQQIVGDFTSTPDAGHYPTWLWTPATAIRFNQEVSVPDKPDNYQLAVALVEQNSISEPQLTPLNIFIKVE